jgi:pilus assembly protein Flp/PilA
MRTSSQSSVAPAEITTEVTGPYPHLAPAGYADWGNSLSQERHRYAATTRLLSTARGLARGEEGASLAEYGLLLVLIAVICIIAIAALGTNISKMYSMAAASI